MAGLFAWIAGGVGAVAAAGAAAVGTVAATFDVDSHRGTVAERLSAAIGREVRIDGPLAVDWGWVTRLHAEGFKVRNADWSDEPWMLTVEAVDAGIRLRDLVVGRIDIPDVTFDRPLLLLERGPEGQANWRFDPKAEEAVKDAAPASRRDVPIVGRILSREGRVTYRDRPRGIELAGDLSTLTGEGGDGDRIQLSGTGQFGGQPFRLDLEGGSLVALRYGSDSYPLRAEASIGRTRAILDGSIADPITFEGPDLGVEISGPGLQALFPIVGLPAPETPDYELKARIRRDGAVWSVADIDGRIGKSDVGGTLSMDAGGEIPRFTGEVTSDHLDLADLGGFLGKEVEERERERKTLFPDGELPVERLRAADVDIRLTSRSIVPGGFPVDRFDARFRLADGVLTVDPLDVGVMQGAMAGRVVLDGRQPRPPVTADLRLRGVPLSAFFGTAADAGDVAGAVQGRLRLQSAGRSVKEVMARTDGEAAVVLDGGHVGSATVRNLVGPTVAEALGILAGQDIPVEIRCVVGRFPVKRGQVTTEAMVVDTTDLNVLGGGTVDLRRERLALEFQARPKKPGLATARTPITLTGPLIDPQVGIEPGELVARGAAAVALGIVLTPLAAIIPFLNPGLATDSPCGRLIGESGAARP